MPFRKNHAAGFHLVHQRQIVGGDDDGGAEAVQFEKEIEQAAGHRRIDIAGRLVGKQDFGAVDQGAGDGGALLLAARQHRRQHVDALAEPDPFQQFEHVGLVGALVLAAHAQRQRDILIGGQMIEQAEILEDDADAAAQQRQLGRGISEMSRPNMRIRPRVGCSDRKSSLSSVVLPAPEGPVRNWKDFFGMSKVRSRRISGPIP
jgi:hypothetical protein